MTWDSGHKVIKCNADVPYKKLGEKELLFVMTSMIDHRVLYLGVFDYQLAI